MRKAKEYTRELLESTVKECHNFAEVCISLGVADGGNSKKRIKDLVEGLKIDHSHFDSHYKARLQRKYPVIQKECSICKRTFETQKGHPREKLYCSSKCANKSPTNKRFSEESIAKRRKTLAKKFPPNRFEKSCKFCQKRFCKRDHGTKFCGRVCAIKFLWTQASYRQKLASAIQEKIASGTHKGWQSRSELSYAEKFFKRVIDQNLPSAEYFINHPVCKLTLGFENISCYFLDFYFPQLNLDLEIDGKQHNLPERKASDEIRDKALTQNGYQIYRIKWKNLNKPENQRYMEIEIQKFLAYFHSLSAQSFCIQTA